jgi:sulfatase maturation enzyme AslB (radical SAM superfamily)
MSIPYSGYKGAKTALKELLRESPVFPLLKNARDQTLKTLFPRYDRIFCDITNVCNLRCPHCYNNWNDEYLQKPLLMTMEHFEKVLPLASLTLTGSFYLSCAFEPTLHPKFTEMLKKIPPRLQKQIVFTTNLTTNISDHTFETLSVMRLNQINISVESFKPEIFEQCRKNAKYERFINNLERLVHYFKKEPNSPRIRFITLVTKLNAQEIPSIIEKCHTRYHAFESEIRYPWINPGPWNTPGNIDWFNKFALPVSDWEAVVKNVLKVPFRSCVVPPQKDSSADQEKHKSLMKILWIRPDGLLRIEHGKDSDSFDINTIENLSQLLKKKLKIPAR